MTKINPKELLKRVKSKSRPERANVTFRLNTKVMERFKAECAKQGAVPTAIVEEFMIAFVDELKK